MSMLASQSLDILIWGILMLLAIPYVRHAKHPRAKTVAAYLVFVTLFSVGAVVMYTVLLMLLGWAGRLDYLHHPLGAAAFLALVFVPPFLLGRWQLKKPPWQNPAD
jgi:hypothetical protein